MQDVDIGHMQQGQMQLTSRVGLRPEVLDRIQVGQVHPLPVGRRTVIPILLHVQTVQAHIHTVHSLEQQDHLQVSSTAAGK